MQKLFLCQLSIDELTDLFKQAVKDVLQSEQLPPSSSHSPPSKDLINILSSKEVCHLLHISPPTLISYRKMKKIKWKKIGGKYYYLLSEVESMITPSKTK